MTNVEAILIALMGSNMKNNEDNIEDFRKELEILLNRTSMESGSNTPDFILARYLLDCLLAFDNAVTSRENWYGAK